MTYLIIGWYCDICDTNCYYKSKYERHLQAQCHNRRVALLLNADGLKPVEKAHNDTASEFSDALLFDSDCEEVFDERLLSENSCDEMSITEGEVDQVSHNVLADHYCCTYYCITGSS